MRLVPDADRVIRHICIRCIKVPLTPKKCFRLIKSTSFPDYFREKNISIDKIPAFLQAFKNAIFYVHQRAKWDLGRATSDVTSGTWLGHSSDF